MIIDPSSPEFPDDGLSDVVDVTISVNENTTVEDLMLHACNTPSK